MVEAYLREDLASSDGPKITAVLVCQTDTASSVNNDVPALRSAIDAAGHPALFMVDCVASLGCEEFRMDACRLAPPRPFVCRFGAISATQRFARRGRRRDDRRVAEGADDAGGCELQLCERQGAGAAEGAAPQGVVLLGLGAAHRDSSRLLCVTPAPATFDDLAGEALAG